MAHTSVVEIVCAKPFVELIIGTGHVEETRNTEAGLRRAVQTPSIYGTNESRA